MTQRKKHHDLDSVAPQGQEGDGQASQESAQPELSATERLAEQVTSLEKELEESQTERLRVLADFQNFRRRSQQDLSNLRQFATENLVVELLPVLDNFERTVTHLRAGVSAETMLDGINAVEKQLRSVLESQNVRKVASVGEQFDPTQHEAIESQESDEHPHDTVIEEVQPGYRIGEKVIRPARVKVAKKP